MFRRGDTESFVQMCSGDELHRNPRYDGMFNWHDRPPVTQMHWMNIVLVQVGGRGLCQGLALKRDEASWRFPPVTAEPCPIKAPECRRVVLKLAASASRAHLFPPSGCSGTGALFYSNLVLSDSRWIMRQVKPQLCYKCFWHTQERNVADVQFILLGKWFSVPKGKEIK